MARINLQSNEAVILKEECVAHGGVMAIYTDELILTNLNIYCVHKGMFGNTKNIFCYPLNQIKVYDGKVQAICGKLSNGTKALEIYLVNGCESFNFQSNNNKTIQKWITEINKVLFGSNSQITNVDVDDDDYSNTVIGEVKEAWEDLKREIGIKTKKKPDTQQTISNSSVENIKINKKCISCSAPLIGNKGQLVHCRYCDTDQTL